MQLSIPKPCNENWNDMTPKVQGRFCGSCSKTVVDFTNKTSEEVKDYMTKHKGDATCGRFRVDQLSEKEKRATVKSWYLKRFAIAAYVVFGFSLFSCGEQTNYTDEASQLTVENNIGIEQVLAIDTIPAVQVDTPDIKESIKPEVLDPINHHGFEMGEPVVDEEIFIMGDIAAPLEEPIQVDSIFKKGEVKDSTENNQPKDCGSKSVSNGHTTTIASDSVEQYHIKMGKFVAYPGK